MKSTWRQERIEKLLHELRYEVTRGMMEGEIDESLSFSFIVGASREIPKGVVNCRFETMPTIYPNFDHREPKLRVVGGRDAD